MLRLSHNVAEEEENIGEGEKYKRHNENSYEDEMISINVLML